MIMQSDFFRVVFCGTQQRGDGIKFSPSSSNSGGASSVVRGRVEVCLSWISLDSVGVCLRQIRLDLVVVRLCSSVYRLDPSDLRFCSSAAVAGLVRWSCGVLA